MMNTGEYLLDMVRMRADWSRGYLTHSSLYEGEVLDGMGKLVDRHP